MAVQRIQPRRDTAANWTAANPTLAVGELGYETDTKKSKRGDGVTAWTSLAYSLTEVAAAAAIDSHLGVFTATGADDTSALNTFLAQTSPAGVKKLIGSFTVSGTLTLPLSDMILDLTAAVITTSATAATVLAVTGDRVTVQGGRIVSPASWDGTNSGGAWTYAVVLVTGADCTVRGLSLNNVMRVGVGFKDANGTSRAVDCTIVGNYPAASWTEVETMHFGIGYDPGATSAKLVARGNTVRSCVQGLFLGNYGTGSSSGSIVQGNTFEGCHNHAVYGSASVTEVEVLGNSVVDCSRPVALTGSGHDVSHNVMTTTLASGNLSEVCGIQMRDAVDCTVSFNRMKGLVHSTVPAIDLSRTGTNTTLTGNRVIGNKVEVTGANTAIGIRVGSGAETTMHGNIVASNNVKGAGVANQGVIGFFGATGSQGFSNKCLDNVVTITGNTNGVYVSEQRGLDVVGNHVRLEYDSASAVVLGAVYLTNNSTATKVRNNDIECTAAFGANVTLRAIWEAASSNTTANRVGPNRYSIDPTKAIGVVHVMQTTSGSVLTESGMTGAPATVCGPGSTWTRADGGTSTTFYVKESVASSAAWVAK